VDWVERRALERGSRLRHAEQEEPVQGQGRRMKSSSQKNEHIIIVPGSLLATGADANSGCSVATNEVDGNFAQDGQIAGCRPVPDAAVVLVEGDIQ